MGHVQTIDKIDFSVITVSDTRTEDDDVSGARAIELIKAKGYSISDYMIVKDDSENITQAIEIGLAGADCVFLTGGTGLSGRDVTIEAVKKLDGKEIRGFGELFRYLSFEEIGSRALLSHAMAMLLNRGNVNRIVVASPGSPNAVETALTGLLLPVIGHLLWEARR